ncbi:unnamed protein product [Eruca vesicaria subsp. sativa]|uniref:Uncharacterized protein n=1 Tax=Eruca vesicaria subsp. sativa TaxID=29727 RepID=A0ABC8L324_ERUVS|nr:unnamed protein product [Eruca vesicaria subsp. sativa]
MARVRKLTISQSERYLGSNYSSFGDSNGNSVTDESELTEEDVWSHTVDHSPEDTSEAFGGAWNPRDTVMRNGRACGGLSLAFEDMSPSPTIVHQIRGGGGEVGGGEGGGGGGGHVQRQLASSAPVNVPDWSKIYRVNSVESIHESEEEEEDEESGVMPPHEYLAKSQKRRSRKSGGGASVFEGVGRTLKGRELRRVRDAIWSQTGFYG